MFGLIASSISGNLSSNFDSIQTVTVGAGGQASASFTSLPTIYKHLQIRLLAKSNRNDQNEAVGIQFNSDTGNNYASHGLWGDGSSAAASALNVPGAGISLPWVAGSLSTNAWGGSVIDILDYQSTAKNKTVKGIQGFDNNGNGQAGFGSGVWVNTAAITTITVKPFYGSLWNQYSVIALYGIKG